MEADEQDAQENDEASREPESYTPDGMFARHCACMTLVHRDGQSQVTGPQRESIAEAVADLAACERGMQDEFRWQWEERQSVARTIMTYFYRNTFTR
ncbi:MAG TPA: hypothetical protein VIG47_09630 [Gemmatimonadaceae bacterium]|jgi:uncharacterized membrane protein